MKHQKAANLGSTALLVTRCIVGALVIAALSGCAPVINPVSIISTIADGISYVATGKGSTDHVISGVTDQDCAMHRGLAGKPLCAPREDALSPTELDAVKGDLPAASLQVFHPPIMPNF